MPYLRLLHISDTHFSEYPNRINIYKLSQDPAALSLARPDKKISPSIFPSSFDSDLAIGLASFIHDVGSDVNLIIHSGDLSITGRPSDLDAAFMFVDAKPDRKFTRDGKPTIGAYSDKLFICPGNHDRYKDNFGNPWSINFNLKFRKYWKTSPLDISIRMLPEVAPLICVVAVDFCLRLTSDAENPVLINQYGRGKAYTDILDRLDSLMVEIRASEPRIKFIWVIHFPPFAECSKTEQLINFDGVVILADKHNVSVILSGHLHKESVSKTRYGTPIICAGTACAIEESPDCWIHLLDMKITDDNSLTIRRTDYHWNDADAEFQSLGPKIVVS